MCYLPRSAPFSPLPFFFSLSLSFFIPSSRSNCRLSSRYSRPPQDCEPLQKYQLLLGRLLSFQISRVLAFKCRKFTPDFSAATCPGDAGHHIRAHYIFYYLLPPPPCLPPTLPPMGFCQGRTSGVTEAPAEKVPWQKGEKIKSSVSIAPPNNHQSQLVTISHNPVYHSGATPFPHPPSTP